METSNGQIHQPTEEKLIIDTDPGIGAYPPLLLISSLSTSFHLQGGPMVASPHLAWLPTELRYLFMSVPTFFLIFTFYPEFTCCKLVQSHHYWPCSTCAAKPSAKLISSNCLWIQF